MKISFMFFCCLITILISTAFVGAQSLPEVNMPSITEQSTDSSAVPDVLPAVETPTNTEGKTEESSQQTFMVSLGTFEDSIMFSDDDMNNLRRVLENYEMALAKELEIKGVSSNENEEIARMLAGLGGKQDENALTEPLPQFYLSTILYRSADQWSVWVNGQRYIAQAKIKKPEAIENLEGNDDPLVKEVMPEFEITSISKKEASFLWRPKNLPRAIQMWEVFEAQKKDESKAHKKSHRQADIQKISFDNEKGTFSFTMRANQTFDPESMIVLEGQVAAIKATVPSEEVNTNQANGEAGAPDADSLSKDADALDVLPEQETPAPKDSLQKDRESADKLINLYKNAGEVLPRPDPNSAVEP